VQYGDNISFRVDVKKGYNAEDLVVKANGKKLTPKKGLYTIENITEDVEITAAFDDGMKKFKLTDKETNVTVSGYAKDKVKLKVSKLSKTDEAYKALAAKAEQLDVLGAYDVQLSGAKTKGSYRVTVPVDAQYEGKFVYVLRQKDEKTVEKLTVPVKNGKVTFKSKYVSPIMVAGSLKDGIIEPPKSGDKETGLNTGILLMELSGMLFIGTLLMRGKKKVADQ
jgi:hypothetical protein